MAYERRNGPIGYTRSDFNAALIAATFANAFRDTKKKKTPFDAGDFMPEWGKEEQTPEQQKGIFHMLARTMKAAKGRIK